MTKTKELEEIRYHFQEFFELTSESNMKFKEHYEETYNGGAFDTKTKRLIALCGGIVAGCKGCILGQADLAIQHGATVEEIMEVCGIALSLGGTLAGSQIALVVQLLKEKGMV